MKNVTHIFFDLDHTLWDFEKNSSEAIIELFEIFNLHKKINSIDEFIKKYQIINAEYWNRYNHGLIDKQTVRYGRFKDLFSDYTIDDHIKLAHQFADEYLLLAPTKKNVFPGTHETLNYLKNKYELHIITNGFKEVQAIKMKHTQLDSYFKSVLCSEDVGVNKPHPDVFNAALKMSGANSINSLMIGDSFEADIVGAKNVGMKTVFFNPQKKIQQQESAEIQHLADLKNIL